MTTQQAAIFILLVAVIGSFAIRNLIRHVDRNRPKQIDWLAHRKRGISHRGYKSRMGAR